LTGSGVVALRDARHALDRMWEGLELPRAGRT
jgi:hypothetical protein